MCTLWCTATVASIAFHNRQTLEKKCLLERMTVDEAATHTKHLGVCDFGLRGVPNIATGAAGGMAALTSSHSSDNSAAMFAFARDYGGDTVAKTFANIGSSIPAAEHTSRPPGCPPGGLLGTIKTRRVVVHRWVVHAR